MLRLFLLGEDPLQSKNMLLIFHRKLLSHFQEHQVAAFLIIYQSTWNYNPEDHNLKS
jgi:hypothetical protein